MKKMKKRFVSLLLALVMVLGLLPTAALAEEEDPAPSEPATVTVDFTAYDNDLASQCFLMPRTELVVREGTAEKYGVQNAASDHEVGGVNHGVTAGQVTVMDAIFAAHEFLYGDSFTTENFTGKLNASSSLIRSIFGVSGNIGFTVNNQFPIGEKSDGYAANEYVLKGGDSITFFRYGDDYTTFGECGMPGDYYGYFDAEEKTVTAGETFTLTMQGYFAMEQMMGSPGSATPDLTTLAPIPDAVIGTVDADTGEVTLEPDWTTGENGQVSLKFEEAGTYYVTAQALVENTADYFAGEEAVPVVAPWCEVTVVEPEPVEAEVTVTVSKAGGIVNGKDGEAVAMVPVNLTGKAVYTLDDVFKAVHDACYDGGAEAGYESANGTYGLYVTKLWGDTSGQFGYQVNNGTVNVMGLSQSVEDGDVVEAYILESAYPDSEAYAIFDKTTAQVTVGGSLELSLEQAGYDEAYNMVFSPCEGATLTLDGETTQVTTDAAGKATVTFSAPGTYVVSAVKTKTVNDAAVTAITAPVCKVTVTLPDASITVPSGAELFVGSKSKHYVPFTEVPAAFSVENGDGTTTYYYDLKTSSTYNYRVSGEDYITYGGTFKKTANYAMTVAEADLRPEGKTKTTIDRDVASNNGYNVGDIYLNINAQGYLKLDEAGDTYQLVNLRNWEAVDSITNNYFIEPDYHYTVLNEDGTAGDGVVTVSDSGMMTAQGEGTAIVLVTYDAMTLKFTTNAAQFYGAIWPENTGVFVVSVGAGDSGITTGMTLNEGRNTVSDKLAGDAIDAEHDVIYFTGSQGSYTFTPETAGCTVSVANPAVGDTMTFSGFRAVSANGDGSFTVPLVQGRNIVKLEKDGKAEYQVITAKRVTYTVNNGAEEIHPGDAVTIKFDTLYHPANKLAGVYNMSAVALYTDVEGCEGELVGGASSQYNFASNANTQTVDGIVKRSVSSWGLPSYAKDKSATFTIPEDWAEETFTLSGGVLVAVGYGDHYGNHRGITLTEGKAPNFNASAREAYLGQLPDIVIPVTVGKTVTSIEVTTQPTKTEYLAGEDFDPAGMVVKATYSDGSTNENVTSYTVSAGALTAGTVKVTVAYGGKTADVPVTVTQPKVTAIAVTTAPGKTSYTAGEVFDPTGMVVTATYENGKTAPVTSYTYAPNRKLTENDTAMIITYTGSDAAEGMASVQQAITVAAASSDPSTPAPQTITVSFTLKGDAHHDPDEGPHTLKAGNLETWISKTNVEVDKGSKVIDVLTTALALAGIPYENPTGNYVTEVNGLAEFDNGANSGWMYTLNGTHPELGVAEQTVKNGDVIVFHYTDDYTVEEGSEKWSGSGGSAVPNAIDKVESLIDAIGTVTESSGSKIEAARKAYDALTDAQKALVGNYKTLTDAELAYAKLTGKLPFTDVKEGDYCYDAVKWAVEQGITNGTTATTFAPGAGCTRAQMVTFLWRAAGSPEPAGKTNPFTDVKEDDYYFKALLWAMENGITKGTTETTFSPNAACTRGQMAAFLYRSAKSPAVEGANPFTDVQEGDYFFGAVLWAAEEGVTKGTTDTTFSPAATCTRGQMVTFLYRYLAK